MELSKKSSVDLESYDWLSSSARMSLYAPPKISGPLTQCISHNESQKAEVSNLNGKACYASLRGNRLFGFKTKEDAIAHKPLNTFLLDKKTHFKIENGELMFTLTRKNRSLTLMADSEAMLSQWQANILLCISFQKENEFSPELVSGVHTWEFHRPTIPVSCTACKKNSLRFRQEGSLCHTCGAWVHSLCRENVTTPCEHHTKRRNKSDTQLSSLPFFQDHPDVQSILKIFSHQHDHKICPFANSQSCLLYTPKIECSPRVEETHYLGDLLAIHQTSTYPLNTNTPQYQRMGDPIADQFAVARLQDSVIAVVADGCSWGRPARKAASDGSLAFLKYLKDSEFQDTTALGELLLKGCMVAHDKINETECNGTATLCGGMLLQVKEGKKLKIGKGRGRNSGKKKTPPTEMKSLEKESKWAFVGVNVGDCKALLFSRKKGEFSDLTSGNREDLDNPSDPGGRLGPYHQNGGPDLRNLQLFFTFLEEDDIVILVSDGVHDNLDPSSLHLTPQQAVEEAGLEEYKNLKFCSWAEIDPMVGSKIKEQYLGYILHEEVFKDVDLETLTPRMITKNLIEKCQRTTQPLRTWMEKNPSKRQPADRFPGKMDHVTAVAIAVKKCASPIICNCGPPSPKGHFLLKIEDNHLDGISFRFPDDDSESHFRPRPHSTCGSSTDFIDPPRHRANSLKEKEKVKLRETVKEPRLIRPRLSPSSQQKEVLKERSYSDSVKMKSIVDDKKGKKDKVMVQIEKVPKKAPGVTRLEPRKKKAGTIPFRSRYLGEEKIPIASEGIASKSHPTVGFLQPIFRTTSENSNHLLGLSISEQELLRFLQDIRMEGYFGLFVSEKIDLDILRLLSAAELRLIGVPLGDAKRIQSSWKHNRCENGTRNFSDLL